VRRGFQNDRSRVHRATANGWFGTKKRLRMPKKGGGFLPNQGGDTRKKAGGTKGVAPGGWTTGRERGLEKENGCCLLDSSGRC